MQKLKGIMKKIGQFTYYFSDMDTVILDKNWTVVWEYGQNQLSEPLQPYLNVLQDHLKQDQEEDVYEVLFHSDALKINYISAKLYNEEKIFIGTIMVGPFLLEKPSDSMIHDVLFENQLPISLKHSITQYYLSLPLISKYKADMIAEFLGYHTANIYQLSTYKPVIGKATVLDKKNPDIFSIPHQGQSEISVETIEKTYELQNELMTAVEHGDISKAEKLMKEDISFDSKIPDRIPNDPLRSEKNLAFTYNTILRIAGERGGLHPQYIHSISEKYAIQIEKTATIQQLADLKIVMLREYCEAVRKYSLKDYSYLIRKAIEYIRFHLEQELNLDTISEAIHSSTYELSRKFKKETGQSLTDYINKLRIKEALYMMENHNLSITDIAYMTGFNDVNYFTKVFQKYNKMPPSSYRKQL
jgi:two-component system, response regulator YesN